VATPPGLTVEQLPSGPTASFDGSRPVSIGRDGAADVVVAHERTSRQHATLRFDAGVGWVFEDHSSGGTYVDGARVTRLVLSEPVVVTLGNPVEGASLRLVPVPSAPPETPEAPPAGATSPPLVANEAVPSAALPQLVVNEPVPSAAPPPTAPPMTPPVRGVPRGAASQVSIGQLSNVHEIAGRVRIGRAEDNDIVLPDLLVSHHHAELRVSPGGLYEIEDLQSHNGTFVDGRRIRRREALSEGSLVSIGHHLLCLTGGRLQEYVDTGEVSFAAIELSVLAGTRALLDQVSFPLAAGDFLAVLGPTGAGKTTLLRALTGNHPADRGSVLYNGRDVYAAYAELRNRIGYVPQDDILHPQLTVASALGYAARLRFPPDVSAADRRHRVDEVMAELGLTERAHLQVAKLSGGQRKRTSVAIELLTKPSLLFLDEPTSGLDPGYEKSVMELLRSLADGGRTVITVTHSIQSLDLCDRILFSGPGRPDGLFRAVGLGALQFFGLGQYAEVFQHLDRAEPGTAPRRPSPGSTGLPAVRAGARSRRSRTGRSRAAPARERSRPTRAGGTSSCRWCAATWPSSRGTGATALLLFLQAPILGLLMLAVLGHGALSTPATPGRGRPAGASSSRLILGSDVPWERPTPSARSSRSGRSWKGSGQPGLSASAYVLSKALVLGVLTVLQALILVVIGVARQGGPGARRGAVVRAAGAVPGRSAERAWPRWRWAWSSRRSCPTPTRR
jgi:ABC-type cobalamin/Fe3+-siderophores transport system ATPase subunit/pSer/pThr/pTyr-binding forkhead associated (FHA) protein